MRAAIGFIRRTLPGVGNLIALEGDHLVTETLAAIVDADLVIVGNGEPCPRLAVQPGLSARSCLPGALPQEMLARHFGAVNLTVLGTLDGANPAVVTSADAGAFSRERRAPAIRSSCQGLLERPPACAATRPYAKRFSWDDASDRHRSSFAGAASFPVAWVGRARAADPAKGVGE